MGKPKKRKAVVAGLWWARFCGAQDPVGPFRSHGEALTSVVTDLQRMGYSVCTGAFVVVGTTTGKTFSFDPFDSPQLTASLAETHEGLSVADATGRQLVEIYHRIRKVS